MQRYMGVVGVVAGMLAGGPTAAARPCPVGSNSCWAVDNRTDNAVQVYCWGYGQDPLLACTVDAGRQETNQFDRGWADGLGYIDPNVPLHCRVGSVDRLPVQIDFLSLSYGDAVHLRVDAQRFGLTVQESWGRRQMQAYSVPR